MGLTDRISAAWGALTTPARGGTVLPLTLEEWALQYMAFNQNVYGVPSVNQTNPGMREEDIDGSYGSIVTSAYRRNGVIFACVLARMLLFSEARFQFQALVKGRPGELFGTAELARLERPGPNQTTGDLLTKMLLDADLAGNWYGVRRGERVKRMRPDWVTIVLGSESNAAVDARDIDAEIIGYVYHPGGRNSGLPAEALLPDQVAHWAPIPDPLASFRGMSWITPITREVMADTAATSHKLSFFENAATPNMVVSLDKDVALQAYNDFVDSFKEHEPKGWDSYKTLYLGAGAVATVVGANMQQMDFKVTQGAGETRICAAARVPPIIVGVSEGLQAATYSNYGMARRAFADLTMRPLWRGAAGALESIITVPSGSRLWYDDRDIPFLQEDIKDSAEILSINSAAMSSLINGGWKPDDVVDAVTANDLARLKGKHTGLFSVQLQPPQPDGPPAQLTTAPVPPKQLASGRDELIEMEQRIYQNVGRQPVVQFSDGAFRIDPAITLNQPEQAAPVVNVTVPERDVTVNMPEQAAPVVTVEAPPPAEVNVTIEAPPPAELRVEPGAISVDVHPPDITVQAPSPAEVTVNLPEPKAVRKTVKRDKAGRITEVTEE